MSLLMMIMFVGVGGEFERVLEVDMYGSRPGSGSGSVDSLVVPSRDYYKYEELSDTVLHTTPDAGPLISDNGNY